jgi:hypothetical protein
MKLYGAIAKFETLPDGMVELSGLAAADVLDEQGEIVTAAAMKAAIPGFMALGGTGPLREMHKALAAGKVTHAEARPDGSTLIVARVVDPTACEKVRQGVYRGFSVRGKILKRDGKKITGVQLQEISLIDRPDCPTAMFKLAGGVTQLAPRSAFPTLPDGLAPIVLKTAYATYAERETADAADSVHGGGGNSARAEGGHREGAIRWNCEAHQPARGPDDRRQNGAC